MPHGAGRLAGLCSNYRFKYLWRITLAFEPNSDPQANPYRGRAGPSQTRLIQGRSEGHQTFVVEVAFALYIGSQIPVNIVVVNLRQSLSIGILCYYNSLAIDSIRD